MNKKMFILYAIPFILLLFFSTAFSGERPKEFRGLKWGTHVSQISGLVLKDENKAESKKTYLRPADSLKVGRAQVDVIEYIFVKDQLAWVIMRFEDYAQYLILKSLLVDLYGPPDREEKIKEQTHYDWYTDNDNEGNLTLFWMDELGIRAGSFHMKWKGALKKDSGL